MTADRVPPNRTRSLELWHRTERSLGGGVSTGLRRQMPPHPLFFDRGLGSHLWDVDGNEYIDYVLGWGPVILGHCNPAIVTAVTRQMSLGQTFGSGHRWEYEAAEAVCASMPGVERVLWSNTGTEAVQSALRLARAATGRRRFVKFEGHYHGWMDSVLVSYRHTNPKHMPELETLGQNPAAADDVLVLPWNNADAFIQAMATYGSEIAAVIAEPVLCNSGVIRAEPGFLELLRETTVRTGSLLIFDEVITGFRIALGGACERYGVEPDLRTLGKALGGGMPVSAVVGKGDLIDRVTAGVVHAGTYNGNPLVLSAVSATIKELSKDGVFDALEARGRDLADGFVRALGATDTRFAVNQVGPVVQCALGVDELTSYEDFAGADWKLYDRLVVAMLDRGIFALPGGRWYVSTAHSPTDIETTVQVFAEAVRSVGL